MYRPMIALFLLLGSLALVCESSNCSASMLEELRQVRLEKLRENILAQLGYTEDPVAGEGDVVLPLTAEEEQQDLMVEREYFDLINSSFSESKKCNADEFYAKPITSFIGTLSPTDGLVSRFRRSSGEEDLMDPKVIHQYLIHANFSLSSDLSDISRANLLLYQDHVNSIDLDTSEEKQQVEIRAIVNNIRYFVEEKSLNVLGSGYQTFDITPAAELWVQEKVHGNIVLEVLVTCQSSPNCSMDSTTAKISFKYNADDTSQAPRIITYSKNSLEHTQRGSLARTKRQISPNISHTYCSDDDDNCCLRPLEINFFADLNIRSISRPLTYTANFCDGYCIPSSGLGDRSSLLLQDTPAATKCCSGTEYDSLQVVLTNYNHKTRKYKKEKKRLEQVVVSKCGCA